MRRYSYVTIIIVLTIIIASCSNNQKPVETENNLEELNLHMLEVHEDTELGEYYAELYESMKHRINEHPTMGQPNDFTLQPFRMFENNQGLFYVFLGINRQDEIIKNVTFQLTVGDEDNHLIWDEDTIFLSEEETGYIPPNSVLPVMIPVNKDTFQKSEDVKFEHLDMAITGLYYEEATR